MTVELPSERASADPCQEISVSVGDPYPGVLVVPCLVIPVAAAVRAKSAAVVSCLAVKDLSDHHPDAL